MLICAELSSVCNIHAALCCLRCCGAAAGDVDAPVTVPIVAALVVTAVVTFAVPAYLNRGEFFGTNWCASECHGHALIEREVCTALEAQLQPEKASQ